MGSSRLYNSLSTYVYCNSSYIQFFKQSFTPAVSSHDINPNPYSSFFDQDDLGIPVEDNIRLIVAEKQKFTIREVSPEWCYASEGAKVHAIIPIFVDKI